MVAFVLSFHQSLIKELKISRAIFAEDILVQGLKARNKNSIEQLYKMYAPSLMGIIIRIVRFDEIAEDVLQDTFLKIWKSIEQYDSSKGRLFTWLAKLAKNTAIDQSRNKHFINASNTDDVTKVPIDILNKCYAFQLNTEVIGVKQLIQELKPDQRKILDLIYFEGFTHIEVAEKLNMPLGTVKTKIRLAISMLRQHFNEKKLTIC